MDDARAIFRQFVGEGAAWTLPDSAAACREMPAWAMFETGSQRGGAVAFFSVVGSSGHRNLA
jgi:hypothetical protein